MLVRISIHVDTSLLCFSSSYNTQSVNSPKLIVQTIGHLVKGRQMLQEYLLTKQGLFLTSNKENKHSLHVGAL